MQWNIINQHVYQHLCVMILKTRYIFKLLFDCCNIGFYITSTKLFIIVTSAVTSHYNNVRCKNICLEREKQKKWNKNPYKRWHTVTYITQTFEGYIGNEFHASRVEHRSWKNERVWITHYANASIHHAPFYICHRYFPFISLTMSD